MDTTTHRQTPQRMPYLAPERRLSLATPEDWAWWEARPPQWRSALDRGAFWAEAPPLTVAQEQALRLGRPTAHVAIRTMTDRYKQLLRARYAGDFTSGRLRKYPRQWARTHRARTFRVVPAGLRARRQRELAEDNPLHPLLDWATGDEVFEDRWLWATMPPTLRLGRPRFVEYLLRAAAAAGVIAFAGDVEVPNLAWAPTPRLTRYLGIPPVVVPSALAHQVCAVEVGLILEHNRAPDLRVRALRAGAALTSEARARTVRASGRRPARGDVLPSVADLEVVGGDGRRMLVELISENYRAANLAAKYAGLPADVAFVALNQTVARRALWSAPDGQCWFV